MVYVCLWEITNPRPVTAGLAAVNAGREASDCGGDQGGEGRRVHGGPGEAGGMNHVSGREDRQ